MTWEQINAYRMQVLEVSDGLVTWDNDYAPRENRVLLASDEIINFFIRSMPVGAWITFLAQRNERGREIGTKIYRFESIEYGGVIEWVTFDEPDHPAENALSILKSQRYYRYGKVKHVAGGWGGDGDWYVNYQT